MELTIRFIAPLMAVVGMSGCQISHHNHNAHQDGSQNGSEHVALKEHMVENKDVSFNVYFTSDGRELNHDEWLSAMAGSDGDGHFSEKTMREFAQTIRDNHLDKCGFSLTADPKSTPFFWHIEGKQSQGCNSSIRPGKKYESKHSFSAIIEGTSLPERARVSAYSFSFDAAAQNGHIKRLVIPGGSYTTIQDFASSASNLELIDFFILAQTEIEELFTKTNKSFVYEVETGSGYAQSVPHFYLTLSEK